MQVEHYIYSVAEVASSKLTTGETQTFRLHPGGESIGLYLKSGKLEILETTADNKGLVWTAAKALVERLKPQPPVVRAQALEDSEIICIAKRQGVDRELEFHEINDTLVLPASWGFIVVDGTVVLVDQGNTISAGFLKYVKPRSYDLTLNGPAEVVFIR